ncbi:hypothetical protein SRABI26_00382 [Arthrobacter sp. Bi26]|nr:hypothetical protein SRABI26_00382 [Arthrobacter sp. Bi26]
MVRFTVGRTRICIKLSEKGCYNSCRLSLLSFSSTFYNKFSKKRLAILFRGIYM